MNETENPQQSDTTDYQTQINLLKDEMKALKQTVVSQHDEINELKQTINEQTIQMNSIITHEHYEVQNMREYILKQIRKEFVLYKKQSYPTKLLSHLDDMFNDHFVVKLFSNFCINKMCIEYYMYVKDMDAYYQMKDDLKSLLFYDFRDKYFCEGAPYFLNIKTSVIREICDAIEPDPNLLDKALELVYAVFRVELIREFKHSPQYSQYLLSVRRHKPKSHAKKRKHNYKL